MTEEQIKTIADGFTAMVDKCCKQSDIETCFGEEVFPISFKKQNKTKCIQESGNSLGKHALLKVVLQTAMVTGLCALSIDLPAESNLYLDCTDYSYRL